MFGAMLANAHSSFVQSQWALRAQIEWARIQDKPTDIRIKRNNVLQDAVQTVRIEYDNRIPSGATDDSGSSAFVSMYVFGVRGHPDIDDLDIDEWDTFVVGEKEYTVVSVNLQVIGQIQAYCEAVG